MKLSEIAGLSFGYGLGVITASVSFVRQARTFHPKGFAYEIEMTSITDSPLAKSLAGRGIIRFSSAWWKKVEWRDVLGLAIRIHGQDLLLVTITHPWTMPLAPFTTHYHDFLKNQFFGVSPFRIPSGEEIKIRLQPMKTDFAEPKGLSRIERLERDIRTGQAVFDFQIADVRETEWNTIARLSVTKRADLNPDTLSFSPFKNGLGIRPTGFIQYLRVGSYQLSKFGRGTKSRIIF